MKSARVFVFVSELGLVLFQLCNDLVRFLKAIGSSVDAI